MKHASSIEEAEAMTIEIIKEALDKSTDALDLLKRVYYHQGLITCGIMFGLGEIEEADVDDVGKGGAAACHGIAETVREVEGYDQFLPRLDMRNMVLYLAQNEHLFEKDEVLNYLLGRKAIEGLTQDAD